MRATFMGMKMVIFLLLSSVPSILRFCPVIVNRYVTVLLQPDNSHEDNFLAGQFF